MRGIPEPQFLDTSCLSGHTHEGVLVDNDQMPTKVYLCKHCLSEVKRGRAGCWYIPEPRRFTFY